MLDARRYHRSPGTVPSAADGVKGRDGVLEATGLAGGCGDSEAVDSEVPTSGCSSSKWISICQHKVGQRVI